MSCGVRCLEAVVFEMVGGQVSVRVTTVLRILNLEKQRHNIILILMLPEPYIVGFKQVSDS